jgi:hypothetical protein
MKPIRQSDILERAGFLACRAVARGNVEQINAARFFIRAAGWQAGPATLCAELGV